jgi:hypothetical protein
VEQSSVNVLLIGESEQECQDLARPLEQRGWACWFASRMEDVRSLLDQRPFHLVLSTRPVTQGSALMELLGKAACSVFYSYPVDGSCLWLQASRQGRACLETPAIRPGEFLRTLDRIVAEADGTRRR